jgi:hypothetical protein
MNDALRIIGQFLFCSGFLTFIVMGIAFAFFGYRDNTFQQYDYVLQMMHLLFLYIIAGILLMGFFKKDK